MTVDDLRIHSPPAHGRAEAIVEEGDRLVVVATMQSGSGSRQTRIRGRAGR